MVKKEVVKKIRKLSIQQVQTKIKSFVELNYLEQKIKISELSKKCNFKETDLKKQLEQEIKLINERDKEEDKNRKEEEKQRDKETKTKEKEEEKESKEEKKETVGYNIFTDRMVQAEAFIIERPFFYDKTKLWFLWDEDKWKYERTDEVDVLNKFHDSYKSGTEIVESKARTEILNSMKQVGRKHRPIDPKKSWIQFKDKIYDVKTGEHFNASPKYFMTSPIPYNVGKSEETPTLDKYFREWVVAEGIQDESYIQTLYEILAYCCLPDKFLQRMFSFVGTGSNGKGVFLSIIEKLVGEDNTCSSELKLLATNNFETSAIYKMLVCFIGEADVYDMKNTGQIKKLSGEDKIRYCFKSKTPFSEQSSTTFLMNTNSLPITPDKSKGFYRRWLIVDFPHEFPVGKNIVNEIPEEEFENLSKKVIRICKELYEKKSFTNEGDLDTRIKRYEDRSNPLMRFVEDECEEDPEKYESLKDFSKTLNGFLKLNRLRQMTTIKISRALKEEGFSVSARKIEVAGETINTTCVFGLKINKEQNLKGNEQKEITQTHWNPLLSVTPPIVKDHLKKEWVPMGSNGQKEQNEIVDSLLKEQLDDPSLAEGLEDFK